MKGYIKLLVLIILISGCKEKSQQEMSVDEQNESEEKPVLFSYQDPANTGIDFVADITENEEINYYANPNTYSGGGVALGDINHDGLLDIYFTNNMAPNRLYLNKGDFKFEDISVSAGVSAEEGWSTGATMIDINHDGWLDIYVCRSYYKSDDKLRENLLFVNNGDLTFTESAKEYGINDPGFSIQALFLDYDNDGDPDLFVGNHPHEFIRINGDKFYAKKHPDPQDSDKFYRNNGDGTFSDVTKESGILNTGWTLGIATSDLDKDGWPDIYVAVDHEEPDCYYHNNGDGTFTNIVDDAIKHLSNFSMGLDLADFNNDAELDIVVVDMLAQDNFRQKTQMSGMAPRVFWGMVNEGFHYQYMRNTLQMNLGNGKFRDIGYYSKITNTDWSWAALMIDFDNDGFKDLFVANGYRRDVRDNDYLIALKKKYKSIEGESTVLNLNDMLSMTKTTRLKNNFFKNNGDLTFEFQDVEAGLLQPSFTNGAAYGDLDNDGDLDLVLSNLADPPFLYKNNTSEQTERHYIRFQCEGEDANRQGLGTKVTLYLGKEVQYLELSPTRGFQSSVENVLHFGLGDIDLIDKVEIEWQDGRKQIMENVSADQVLAIKQSDAKVLHDEISKIETYFEEIALASGLSYFHIENEYDDYEKEILLPHKMSQFGPAVASGDANGDGLDDIFIGGAASQIGALFLQKKNGNFELTKNQGWEADNICEDVDAIFLDIDLDGDQDLYVVSGGNAFQPNSGYLLDRVYLNNGKGKFTKCSDCIPQVASMITSGGSVSANDIDQDGDLDLFVGGRVLPGHYPFSPRSFLLLNNNGKFQDVTEKFAPDLVNAGLVTSSLWTDIDQDGLDDLVVTGEWMPVRFFRNTGQKLSEFTAATGLAGNVGWWNELGAGDFDGDGDIDLVAGNLGLNYKYQASAKEPFHVYCADFDTSGSYDIVLGYYNSGTCFPVRGRECSSQQIPGIKNKFPNYKSFGEASLWDVYGDQLDQALHYSATEFASMYLENLGGGKFRAQPLPAEAQFAPVNGIVVQDFTEDGNLDILIAGNLHVSEVETGRADAGIGCLLVGNGKGEFVPMKHLESGFFADGDVRKIKSLKRADGKTMIIVANNDDRIQLFLHKKDKSGGVAQQ